MSAETILVLGTVGLVLLLQLTSLLRRSQPEVVSQQAMGGLQSSIDRQATQIAMLQGEVKADLARQSSDLAEKLGAVAIDQTRALNEGLNDQRRMLQEHADRADAHNKALAEQLSRDAAELRDKQQAQRDALAEQAVLLRRDLTAGISEVRQIIETLKIALIEGHNALGEGLAGRLAKDVEDTRAILEGHRASQLKEAAALRTDLSKSITDLNLAVETMRTALSDGQSKLAAALNEGQKGIGDSLTVQLTKHHGDVRAFLEIYRDGQVKEAAAFRADLGKGIADLNLAVEAFRAVLLEGQAKFSQIISLEMSQARDLIDRKSEENRNQVDVKLKEIREINEAKLAEIQKSVNEQLQSSVEKQMSESFSRVIDQFTAIQHMMGNVQAVASQVGDLKRLFGNVKARGGWGEGQVRSLLEDILPAGTWETNVRLREDSMDMVEFAITMPTQGGQRAVLPVDAKFPTEDYDRLLLAAEAADIEAERNARAALERRIRQEAAKIAAKYIYPPRTVEFAVLYLPNDGLYAEVARIPGLTDEIGRVHRIFVLGPSLLPAMLRTIQLGHVTLALSENAESVRDLLAATKAEMKKMDDVLTSLGKQVGTVSNTIGKAQTRTRAINRKLRGVEVIAAPKAEAILELNDEELSEEELG